jgi:hypothetical protein
MSSRIAKFVYAKFLLMGLVLTFAGSAAGGSTDPQACIALLAEAPLKSTLSDFVNVLHIIYPQEELTFKELPFETARPDLLGMAKITKDR